MIKTLRGWRQLNKNMKKIKHYLFRIPCLWLLIYIVPHLFGVLGFCHGADHIICHLSSSSVSGSYQLRFQTPWIITLHSALLQWPESCHYQSASGRVFIILFFNFQNTKIKIDISSYFDQQLLLKKHNLTFWSYNR